MFGHDRRTVFSCWRGWSILITGNQLLIVDLTLAIVLINGWNRYAKSFREVPGSYEVEPQTAVEAT